MQSSILPAVFAAAVLCAAPALAADAPVWARAQLATPAAAAKTASFGGYDWSCSGDACAATAKGDPASWAPLYACKKVAAAFGALKAYSSRGMAMSAGDLEICNKAAK